MCGIFGFIGNRSAAPLLLEGLRRLEYRGYDSSGIVVKNGNLNVHKKVGKVSELAKVLPNHLEGKSGIAHTRWATHCLLYTSPSPRDKRQSRMPSSA